MGFGRGKGFTITEIPTIFVEGTVSLGAWGYLMYRSPKGKLISIPSLVAGAASPISKVTSEKLMSTRTTEVIPIAIDIGAPAINRPNTAPSGYTFIQIENPANIAGIITIVQLYANTNLANCQIGIFYKVNATTFTTRSNVDLGPVYAGFNYRTVSLAVEVGDYLGIYYSSGSLDRHSAGGEGIWYVSGDYIPCTNQAFLLSAGRRLSLYGIGIE